MSDIAEEIAGRFVDKLWLYFARSEEGFIWRDAIANEIRNALADHAAATVERAAQKLDGWMTSNIPGPPSAVIRAFSPDPEWFEREKLKARREERDVVGASLDFRPAGLDGKTWRFFIGLNDDRREDLDLQLAALPAVTL